LKTNQIKQQYKPHITEVAGGLDRLAARTVQNLSEDIAYVSVDGVDTEGVLGNSERPLKTFEAAKNAVPIGGTIKAVGGSYDLNNETVFVGAFIINKAGVTLDITGCQITGRLFYQASNLTIIARGATITNNTTSILFGFLSGGHSNCKLIGGTFNGVSAGSLSISPNDSNITFIDATFTSNKTNETTINGIDCTNGKFINCEFISTGANSITINSNAGDQTYINCKITGTSQGINIADTKIRLYSCQILIDNAAIVGTSTVGVTMDIIAENTYIKGVANRGLILGKIINNIRFTNCIITAGIDAVWFATIERTTANNNNIFERSSLYAGTGDIFFGSFAAADLGNAIVTNCIYNKAFDGIAGKVVENNITTIAGIQNVGF